LIFVNVTSSLRAVIYARSAETSTHRPKQDVNAVASLYKHRNHDCVL
jgi:hypothetical protein